MVNEWELCDKCLLALLFYFPSVSFFLSMVWLNCKYQRMTTDVRAYVSMIAICFLESISSDYIHFNIEQILSTWHLLFLCFGFGDKKEMRWKIVQSYQMTIWKYSIRVIESLKKMSCHVYSLYFETNVILEEIFFNMLCLCFLLLEAYTSASRFAMDKHQH